MLDRLLINSGGVVEDKTLYVEDVFANNTYTGNGTGQLVENGMLLGSGVDIPIGTFIGGGYFGGWINQGGTTYGIIVSPKAQGQALLAWSSTGSGEPAGTITLNNGPVASAALNSASYPAGQFCENLDINGFTDWYLPARDELEVVYRNLKPSTITNSTATRLKATYTYPEGDDGSSDTMGLNRNAAMVGAPYAAGSPVQTTATLFRSGGAQEIGGAGFSTTVYSSSNFNSAGAWAIGFGNGSQDAVGKTGPATVRAIRRMPLTATEFDPYRREGSGGLIWIKGRSSATDHAFYDTARGASLEVSSNLNTAQGTQSQGVQKFLPNGFIAGSLAKLNTSGEIYSSLTFRKAPKFFDVVTYTGTGANRTIPHSLGVAPGCIIIKRTDTTGDWEVYHRSLANTEYLLFNSTATKATGTNRWNSTTATDVAFSLGTVPTVNAPNGKYVAYLFAHDATAEGIIQCGSTQTNASGRAVVELGFEPQWVMWKNVTGTASNWIISDNVRGFSVGGVDTLIRANTSAAEDVTLNAIEPSPTGFALNDAASTQFVYVAVRRGPMRTPTDATKVFQPFLYSGTNTANRFLSTTITPDLVLLRYRSGSGTGYEGMVVADRLRGQAWLKTALAQGETYNADGLDQQSVGGVEYGNTFSARNGIWIGPNTGTLATSANINANTTNNAHLALAFKRAPKFFDIATFTTDAAKGASFAHNLKTTPELVLIKQRTSSAENWWVWASALSNTQYLVLNTNEAAASRSIDITVSPTQVTTGAGWHTFAIASNVAYLFATCPGVCKVGSFVGNGTNQDIDCGFSGSARFIMTKRVDAAGDWYFWDAGRGINAAAETYLTLNTSNAPISVDVVDPTATGFNIRTIAQQNVSGATYIYLAIA